MFDGIVEGRVFDLTESDRAQSVQLALEISENASSRGVNASVNAWPMTLPKSATTEVVDESIRTWIDSGNDWSRNLIIDLSAVAWIDVPALMHILAVVRDRIDSILPVSIRLPQDRRVRDFMRVWEFSDAFRTVVGSTLYSLVDPRDRHFFGEGQESFEYFAGNARAQGEMLRALERSSFFGFRAFGNLSSRFQGLMIQDACNLWNDPVILRVLKRHLRGPEGDISRVVIYESLANARQHPDAETVCIASRFDWGSPKQGARRSYLTICVWDDGQSILSTLKHCLEEGLSIRSQSSFATPVQHFRTLHSDAAEPIFIPTDFTPTIKADDWMIVLSSFLPGITRKGAALVEPVPEYGDWTAASARESAEPGIGLYTLLRSVVDSFGGRLFVRTGNCFLAIKKNAIPNSLGARYQVKIWQYPSQYPTFRGNMLTVQLPLSRTGRSAIESAGV